MLRNSLNLFDCELTLIEQDTRNQAFSLHKNPAQPSTSLVKSICYPQLFKVTTKATGN